MGIQLTPLPNEDGKGNDSDDSADKRDTSGGSGFLSAFCIPFRRAKPVTYPTESKKATEDDSKKISTPPIITEGKE